MTDLKNPVEALFEDALRDALTVVLQQTAERVQPEPAGPLGLGISEAAELLGVSETAMRELCHRPDFPAVKVAGKYLISRAGLAAWLEKETGGTVGR